MEIKFKEFEVLQDSLNALDHCVLPRQASSRFTNFIVKEFTDSFTAFNKERVKICEKYAEKDEEGKFIFKKVISPNGKLQEEYQFGEKTEDFAKEMNEYLEMPAVVNFEPITEAMLGDSAIPVFVEKTLKRLGFIL